MTALPKLLLGFLAFALIGTACQTAQELTRIPSYTAANAPKVDGKLQDWKTPMAQAKDYSAFQYNLAHDEDNLYVGVRILDKGMQQRVMLYGLTVFMDTTGKRKESIGLVYPLPFSEDQMNKAAFKASPEGVLDRNLFNRVYARMSQEFELLGFVEDNPKERIRVSNLASKDLKTAMGFDQLDAMLIELKVPFQQLYDRPLRYDEAISLQIQVNAPQPSADEEPGLFDNANNPVLSGSRQNNPMLQGNSMLQGNQRGVQQQRQHLHRNPNAPIGTWATIQLSPIGDN